MTRKPRSDTGAKRAAYKTRHDDRGYIHKENKLLRSFWSTHKMEDMIKLTVEQVDAEIALWIEEFREIQMKRNLGWTWPVFTYEPNPEKKEKKINTEWNSGFSNK